MPTNGVMKDASTGIFIGRGKIVLLVGMEGNVKNEKKIIFSIACFNETSVKVY